MNAKVTLKTLSLAFATMSAITVTALPSQAADLGGLQAIGLDCSNGLVTAGGSDFTACEGAFVGNDTDAENTFLTALNNGLFADFTDASIWLLWGKSDADNFAADQGKTDGRWGLLGADSLTGPFVLSLKASNTFSAYLFTDATL